MNGASKFVWVLVAGLVVLAGGCGFLKREEGRQRVILKAGWQVGGDQTGWVAVPNTVPKEVTDASKGITYAVLSTNNVVPDKLEGWYAVSPKLFENKSGIKLAAGKSAEGEKWDMKEGRRVPKDKDGWIGVPLTYPRVERKSDEIALAVLSADQVVPKELDGWAAVDRDTMAKLATESEMKNQTIPEKKK